MPKKNRLKRAFIMSVFLASISFSGYYRDIGSTSVPTFALLMLLLCGVGIGIFVVTGAMMLRGFRLTGPGETDSSEG